MDRLSVYSESFKIVQEDMSEFGVVRTCANCTQCDLDKDICKKYGAKPPIRVIAFGCPEWTLKLPF